MTFLSFNLKSHIETNLVKTILPQKIINSTSIVPITNKYASVVKVVFEAEDEKNLDTLKSDFTEKIDTEYFEINKPNITSLMEFYLSQPTNFLSYNTRELLKNKKYDEVYEKSLEALFNPTGIQLSTMDKDPYLLFDDFIMSNRRNNEGLNNIDDKYYDFLSLKIKTEEGLSPDLSNRKIAELIDTQKILSDKGNKIYLAGSPIHSYHTSKKSALDINLICILSTLMIIFLTYRYFKNLKLLIPIALSIIFGMLSGYIATKLWFKDFQIITMVFSTTLIGIGIDYAYHYFFTKNVDKALIKNLSLSLLSTIIPFVLLYLTGIELLKQVAVFTIFGLTAIYLVVVFIYPCFNFKFSIKTSSTHPVLYKILIVLIGLLSIAGLFRIHFNDSLTAFYKSTKELQKAETLYNQVAGNETKNVQLITLSGENLENILQKEETVTDILAAQNIDYLSLSKFLPSAKRQQENFELVKNLYNNNLNKYSDVLSDSQIQNLKNTKFTALTIDLKQYPYLSGFLFDNNKSMIIVYNNDKLNVSDDNIQIVNIASDIEKYLKHYRIILIALLPVVILVLYGVLLFIYGKERALKILIPPLTGIFSAICLTSLIKGEINLFSIISIFLVLGFTMDYSIFRTNPEENTESAILVSCLTTSFAFLLLSFSGFKLLSSISLILFFGILTSYLSGYILFKKQK